MMYKDKNYCVSVFKISHEINIYITITTDKYWLLVYYIYFSFEFSYIKIILYIWSLHALYSLDIVLKLRVLCSCKNL